MFKKITVINLLVLAVYVLIITFGSSAAHRGFSIAVGMGVCVAIQVGLNVIAGLACLVMGRRDPGRGFLGAAAILVPAGFITWLLLLSVYG